MMTEYHFESTGRCEIGGNHTDHQGGKVIACAVDLTMDAYVAPGGDSIEINSEGHGSSFVSLDRLEPVPKERGTTAALIRGIAAGFRRRGLKIGGFTGRIISHVPEGSGLSSSAAFEVLISRILSGLYNGGKVDPVLAAQICQEAENEYFGKPCGLMDQLAVSLGGMVYMDFSDSEAPETEEIDADLAGKGYLICVTDTKGSHADLTDEYAAVPAEMKKAAAFFGKDLLGQVGKNEFYDAVAELREYAGDRAVLRGMHFFLENERAEKEKEALKSGNMQEFLRLFKESGESSRNYLQNIYACRKDADYSLSLALAVSKQILGDSGASRVHGGGFAGTIIAIVPEELKEKYISGMDRLFGDGACISLNIKKSCTLQSVSL